ncbi:helix-turn-helix domain-containing protein [Flavonifractor plautii]|uniref:helix-turn-helix domain-containing protein n=1 Tax=Flavonifractor plautii TaxID=292800 RepID=UPI00325ADD12
MLTEFGKALRKIRIDRQQLLRDMADKLGVSSAYLSAVETGKRRIPQDWVSKIASIYSLSCEEQADLQSAADNSVFDVTISLVNASEPKRNAVLSFARALDGLNDEDLKRIMASMKGKEEKRGNRQRAR